MSGLAHVPILAAWFADEKSAALEAVREHVRVRPSLAAQRFQSVGQRRS